VAMTDARDVDPHAPSPVAITLSAGQVEHILGAARGDSGLRGVIAERVDDLRIVVGEALADPGRDDRLLSRSTLLALQVLCAFVPAGAERRGSEIAAELEMSASTTQRYLQTLLKVGLLERSSDTRCYRIPSLPRPARAAPDSPGVGGQAGVTAAASRREGLERLTPREGEVLDQLRRGQSNGQIALALTVSIETVRTHVAHIRSKLGVRSRAELVER
jgi:DNA-binding CsgD family transcriptional regulator